MKSKHTETSIKADQHTVPEVLGKSKSTALRGHSTKPPEFWTHHGLAVAEVSLTWHRNNQLLLRASWGPGGNSQISLTACFNDRVYWS